MLVIGLCFGLLAAGAGGIVGALFLYLIVGLLATEVIVFIIFVTATFGFFSFCLGFSALAVAAGTWLLRLVCSLRYKLAICSSFSAILS